MEKAVKAFHSSKLLLENGKAFFGLSPRWQQGTFYGELVFNTAMTGYPESLTDPSYAGQILVFTYPIIGNYGVPASKEWESEKIHAAGVVISEACGLWSHYSGRQSFLDWLKAQQVPIIVAIDTRALTKVLRFYGTMLGAITERKREIHTFIDPSQEHLVSRVAKKKTATVGKGKKVVIAIDCGMKQNIVRSLTQLPVTVRCVPYDYDFTHEDYDGIFISNGPGNPEMCPETLPILKKALARHQPIFGICLGIQLLALAAGAKIYKLSFGHRGQNQPCIDLETRQCYMTSQNHSYAVDKESLPKEWKVLYENLNDHSVEGICHLSKPFFAVQFHPEASPGPLDMAWMFEKFYRAL